MLAFRTGVVMPVLVVTMDVVVAGARTGMKIRPGGAGGTGSAREVPEPVLGLRGCPVDIGNRPPPVDSETTYPQECGCSVLWIIRERFATRRAIRSVPGDTLAAISHSAGGSPRTRADRGRG